MTGLSARYVLVVALATELVLALIYFIWAWFAGELWAGLPRPGVLVASLFLTLPLALANYLVLRIAYAEGGREEGGGVEQGKVSGQSQRFLEEVIWPLVSVLDWKTALAVAALAGFGEELFFRGVLQNEFGLIFASLAFSLLHFGFATREYYLIVVWYFLIGLYLGVLYQLGGTLWLPGLVHFFYDALAIFYLKQSRKTFEPRAQV